MRTPSTLQRLAKARQQVTCAMEETTASPRSWEYEQLLNIQQEISSVMEDLTYEEESCDVHELGRFDSRCTCEKGKQ